MRVPRAVWIAAGLALGAAVLAPLLPPWPARFVVEVRGAGEPSWQLFYDRGQGFVEEDSLWSSPGSPDDRGWRRVQFELPRQPIRAFRLDPPGGAEFTRFGSFCVETDLPWRRRECRAGREWRELFASVQHLFVEAGAPDEVAMRHAGPDPYLVGLATTGDLVARGRAPRWSEALVLLVLAGGLHASCRRLGRGRAPVAATVAGIAAAGLVWSLPAWPARVWIEARLESPEGWDLFRYRPDEPDPVRVARAEPTAATPDGQRRVSFLLPAVPALALRFDPPEAPGQIELRRACVAALGLWPRRCVEGEELGRAMPNRHQLEARPAGGALRLRPTGVDPYLWSDFGDPALLAPRRVTPFQALAVGAIVALLVLAAAGVGRGRLRRLGRGALLALHYTLTPLLGLEAGLWLAEPWLPGTWSLYDPDLGFRARPGASRANALGFPDRDYPFERAPGTFRVVILGDSFGWVGRGRWNYTDLLEESLARRLGAGRVEVVNAGFPATGPAQQRVVWRKWAHRYQPDLVLLASYLGNDVVDSDPARRRYFVGDQPIERDSGDPPLVLFGRPLLPVSRLALAARGRFRLWGPIADEPESGPFLLDHAQYVAAERSLVRPWCRPLGQQYAATLAAHDAAVEGLAADVRERGTDFGVLALPAAWSADPRRAAPILATFAAPPTEFALDAAHVRLAALAARIDVPLLDLLPGFVAAAARGEELYLVDDSHWNRAGNERAAALVEPWLLERWPQAASR